MTIDLCDRMQFIYFTYVSTGMRLSRMERMKPQLKCKTFVFRFKWDIVTFLKRHFNSPNVMCALGKT